MKKFCKHKAIDDANRLNYCSD